MSYPVRLDLSECLYVVVMHYLEEMYDNWGNVLEGVLPFCTRLSNLLQSLTVNKERRKCSWSVIVLKGYFVGLSPV